MKRLTQGEFVERATQKHRGRYSYDQAVYVGSGVKVVIGCPVHGHFTQKANAHLGGSGCNACGYVISGSAIRSSTQDFIEKANKVHEGKYTYGNVNYTRSLAKVTITCTQHGDFLQTPSDHLSGYGCSKCAKRYIPTTEEFIENARRVHGDTYGYSNAIYVKKSVSLRVTCPRHGDFEQTPNDHLSGHGCSKCGYEILGLARRYTLEQFISLAISVHESKYSYEKTAYFRCTDRVIVTCPKHGDFVIVANSHLSGRGCMSCVESKGEKEVARHLEERLLGGTLNFVREYKNPECKNKNTLEFDFAIMRSGEVLGLIEYHGQQHYELVNFGGMDKSRTIKNFHLGKKRDAIKEKFAQSKAIPMLIIPYTEFGNIPGLIHLFVSSIEG